MNDVCIKYIVSTLTQQQENLIWNFRVYLLLLNVRYIRVVWLQWKSHVV